MDSRYSVAFHPSVVLKQNGDVLKQNDDVVVQVISNDGALAELDANIAKENKASQHYYNSIIILLTLLI